MDIKMAVINPSINEVRSVLKPLEGDYIIQYFQSFEDLIKKFQEIELAEAEGENEDSENEGEELSEDEKNKRDYDAEASLVPLDIIMIDMELIEEYSPTAWLNETQAKLKSMNVTPPGDITKFIFTTFERDDLKVSKFQHPFLYDLIFKPFDAPLMLQKVEMIAHLPKITPAGHLYTHKTESKVIVTKENPMIELLEYGISVTNSKEIPIGSFANFRIPYEDKSLTIDFIGRCVACEPNPIHPQFFKCTFIYFGIEPSHIRHQRLHYQKQEANAELPGNLSPEQQSEKTKQQILNRAMQGSNLAKAVQEDNSIKDVVLIDMDRTNVEAIESTFKQNFPNARLHTFPTYIYFNKHLIDEKQKKADQGNGEDEEPWTEDAFSFGNIMSLEIDLESNEMIKMHPNPRDNDFVMGHEGPEFMNNRALWRSMIDENDQEEFDELIKYTSLGEKSETEFKLTNSEGKKRWFNLVAVINDEGHLLLRITDESLKNIRSNNPEEEDLSNALNKVDLILLNTAYIPSTFEAWRESFNNLVQDYNLRPKSKKIDIILMNPEGADFVAKDFCYPNVAGFFDKPVDRRLFVVCLALSLNHKDPDFANAFLKSVPTNREIEIGRPISTKQISEYGTIIAHKKAIQPGTLMNFHSEILTDEDGDGTVGRCLGYEIDESNKDQYLIHFLYYGVMDQALKRIRKMIREEYVSKKEG